MFCSIMTLGGSDRGEAGCSVNGGVGASSDGSTTKPYTYDPRNPDHHYPVGQNELTIPNSSDLAAMDRLLGSAPEMQDWERHESERLQLFLNPGDQIGLPWANAASETNFPNGTGEIREPGGNFLDRRHDDRYPPCRFITQISQVILCEMAIRPAHFGRTIQTGQPALGGG